MNCKTCRHYGFYQMITNGPYGYAGEIPCVTCRHFSVAQDNYEPMYPPPKEWSGKVDTKAWFLCGWEQDEHGNWHFIMRDDMGVK